MKKLLCVLLAAVLLFTAAAPALAEHTHTGELQSLKTMAGQAVPCCGVFRCSSCGETYEATVTAKDVGMPVVNLTGDISGATKERKVTVKLSFDGTDRDFETYATLKWQGDSSLRYPKKNYSITFVTESGGKNKLEVRPEWGKQSKYCLKANWVDYSAARNIVAARLWGEVIHSECRDDEVDALLNGGAIDGFPVLLYDNGNFLGLYTFNMPKDKWIYGMGDGEREGLVMTNGYGACACMEAPIADFSNPAASQYEVEYCSTEDDPEGSAWLMESLNNVITTFLDYDGQELKDRLGQYIDVDRTIDYLVFITALRAEDNRAKNIMWATYDGVTFSPLAYDLEASWGINWNGSMVTSSPEQYPTPTDTNFTRKMVNNYGDEMRARYAELRKSVLSYHNIQRLFNEFAAQIPSVVYQAEKDRWATQPGVSNGNTVSQALSFARKHLTWLDNYYGVSIDETANHAYRAAFSCLKGSQVYVYASQDYAAEPVRAAEAYSVNGATGELTKTNGQVDFKVTVPEGTMASVSVSPAGAYASLLTPAETGEPGVYRVTGMTADVKVTVTNAPDATNAEGYNVTFDCPESVRVLVYPSSDFNAAPTETINAVSVDGDTGIPTKSGDGQVNFRIVSNDPSDVFTVTVTPNKYKAIKDYKDTGVANGFRITKIKADLTVTVQKDTAHIHDFSYQCAPIVGNASEHHLYCACGQCTTEAHSFARQSENGVKYDVCGKCGYTVKVTQCSHLCHSTEPFKQFIWKIELFFFKLFRINRVCECGEAHY